MAHWVGQGACLQGQAQACLPMATPAANRAAAVPDALLLPMTECMALLACCLPAVLKAAARRQKAHDTRTEPGRQAMLAGAWSACDPAVLLSHTRSIGSPPPRLLSYPLRHLSDRAKHACTQAVSSG